MKTAISIPDEIFRKAEDLAKRLDMSRSELYARAVDHYIKESRYTGVKESINAMIDSMTEGEAELDPMIDALQRHTLENERDSAWCYHGG